MAKYDNHKHQLRIIDILNDIAALKEKYPNEYLDIPVYIGDDDELNGIHCAWYTNIIEEDEKREAIEREMVAELINDIPGNIELLDNEVCLLLS